MDSMSDDPNGPDLFIVSEGDGDEQADIVFVHGLGGDPSKTWTWKDIFWPRDLLGKEINNVRVMTFGYDASPTMILARKDTEAIESVARDLLMRLVQIRASVPDRPIVFIAHSFGGLIVEKALVISSDSYSPSWKMIVASTITIIFMGTPQIGSNLASWASVLDLMIQAATRSRNLVPVPMTDLRNMASVQSQFFRQILNGGLYNLQILCIYETRVEKIPRIPAQLVLDESNAVLAAFPSFPIDSSHMNLTKFRGPMDSGYRQLIDYLESALSHQEKFSPIFETGSESAPPDHQEPLTRATNVAGDQLKGGEKESAAKAAQLLDQGQLEKAEVLLRKVLDKRLLVSGEDNLANIKLLGTLASIMWQRGQWPQAETIQSANVEKTTRLLGENHPDTLIAKQNLASTWVDMGRVEDARDLQRSVLSACVERFPDNDPLTTNARSNLAVILTRAQQFEEAEVLLYEVYRSRAEVLGSNHIDTVTAASNLASLYNKMGRFQEAKELQIPQVEILKMTQGSEHPDTLTALDSLASSMSGLGDLDKAFEIFTEVLDARRRVLGPENPLVYESTESLAANYTERGYLDMAIELQREAVNGILRTLGDKSLVAARSGSTLSLIMSKNGQYSQAERNQKTVVGRLNTVYGESDPNTLRAERILKQIQSERMAATAKHRESSHLSSSASSNARGGSSHGEQDSSGSWAWRYIPAYRLSTATIDQFLVSIFGRYDFYISASIYPTPTHLTLTRPKLDTDNFRFWIARDLTRAERQELLERREQAWGGY